MQVFALVSTHECTIDGPDGQGTARIEIFRSPGDPPLFRAHVWVATVYNLYPAELNTGQRGEDLRQSFSADELLCDIVSALADGEEFLAGFASESTETAFERVLGQTLIVLRDASIADPR
jgi:hypothetical protein